MLDSLSTGREAFAKFAWADALAAFTEAERAEPLEPADLLRVAAASWWAGEIDEAVDAFERAYSGFLEIGRRPEAAGVAIRLAELALRRFSHAVGRGWIARAERLLDGEPESAGHAWLLGVRVMLALIQEGDIVGAAELAERGLEVARRQGVVDVESLLLALKGQILVRQGHWAEGMATLDEAAAAAAVEHADPKTSCDVYCQTISACSAVGDYRRAAEWVDEADRWMQRRAIKGYRGVCRVHRAELKRLRGDWVEAESEARQACEELRDWRMLDGIGFANYQVGEVRLGMGDLQGAEEAFAKAAEYGRAPQPGLSLLLLARGHVKQAAQSIAQVLPSEREQPRENRDLLERSRLLPAQVEIALAGDDLAAAKAAADELADIAASYDSDALRAPALTARGAIQLEEGAIEAAVKTLDRAWRLWQDLEVPYESARSRTLLGRARAVAGDQLTAAMDWRAARAIFERLGAVRDLRKVSALLDRGGEVDQRRLTKTFLFSDIVTSTDLVRVIGDKAWNELIAWHDRTLREVFAEHDGVEVRHTGDGFFVSFESAAKAIGCAVGIQRRLKAHRHDHGFAPQVRIGLHTAEASPHGSDFAGHGVHIAARVGAEAKGDEVVASVATLEAAGPLDQALSEPRSLMLKGVTEPLEVRVVGW